MCNCDLGYTCNAHHDCAICGREKDAPEPGLCRRCERTARNAGGPYDRQRHIQAWVFDRTGTEG